MSQPAKKDPKAAIHHPDLPDRRDMGQAMKALSIIPTCVRNKELDNAGQSIAVVLDYGSQFLPGGHLPQASFGAAGAMDEEALLKKVEQANVSLAAKTGGGASATFDWVSLLPILMDLFKRLFG